MTQAGIIEARLARINRATERDLFIEEWSPGDGRVRYRLVDERQQPISDQLPHNEMIQYLAGMVDMLKLTT